MKDNCSISSILIIGDYVFYVNKQLINKIFSVWHFGCALHTVHCTLCAVWHALHCRIPVQEHGSKIKKKRNSTTAQDNAQCPLHTAQWLVLWLLAETFFLSADRTVTIFHIMIIWSEQLGTVYVIVTFIDKTSKIQRTTIRLSIGCHFIMQQCFSKVV